MYEGEATIHYTLSHEYDPVTAPVTIEETDDEFVFEAHDDVESEPIRFLVEETDDGTVRLFVHDGYNVNDERLTRVAFFDDEEQTIKPNRWKHGERFVEEIDLENELYQVIRDAIESEREAQDHATVSEAIEETDVDVPEIPLVVEEKVHRVPGYGSKVETTDLTVVPADGGDSDVWQLWSSAFCQAGDYHTTHKTTEGYVLPPETEGYEDGDELTLHELIDEWHCMDAIGVVEAAEDIREEQQQDEKLEELFEEYPKLRGTDVDPDEAREAIDEAAETGERQHVATAISGCSSASEECNLDQIHHYVTPEGEIEIERVHTY